MLQNSKSMHVCPLCNSGEIEKKFVKEKIDYYSCKSCTFLFSKPFVNVNFQEKIEDFETVYLQYFDTNETDDRNFKSLLNWLNKEFAFDKKNVIDIGCGSGKFVKYLLKNTINSYGIEPSKPLYDKYLAKSDKFYNSSIKDFVRTCDVKYDIITLLDVLEHVEYPTEFIDDVIKLQSPNGYLIIEIPLYGSMLSSLSGKNWHFFNKYHLSYFTKNRLVVLLNEKGYKLVQSKYRGKYFNIAYFIRYIYYFIFHKERLNLPRLLQNRLIYLNTYDILLACFKRNE